MYFLNVKQTFWRDLQKNRESQFATEKYWTNLQIMFFLKNLF